MLNDNGGINGRKINFISYDDAYSPPKAVEQVRKLVENDEVLLVFQTLGTPSNSAIQKYLNTKKVPQLFASTGATKFSDFKNFLAASSNVAVSASNARSWPTSPSVSSTPRLRASTRLCSSPSTA